MTLSDYNLLEQAVINYSKRRDASTLIPTFVLLCENEIDKKLRCKANECLVDAVLNTDDRYLALPPDFSQMRKLQIFNQGRWQQLNYMTPQTLQIKNHNSAPLLYTITENQIEFESIPDSNYTMEMVYFRKLKPLNEDNITNNVLTEFPGIYLFGTLYQLYIWARDEVTAQYYEAKFNEMIVQANAEDNKKRFGAAPFARYGGMIP